MSIFSKDTPQARPAPPKTEPQSGGGRISYIGANIVVDGTITGNENVMIEGAMRGKIHLESELRIGPSARLEATVHAKNVTVEGVVIGDVSADNRIELVSTARVDGNLKAPKIVVAEGAKFKGAVDMGSEIPAEERKADRGHHEDSKEKSHGNRDSKQQK